MNWPGVNNEWYLDNLIPATTYHYRVIVTDHVQTVVSEDRMFTTQGVWGLVQPPYSPLTQVGRGTGWVAAGDLNGDGHPDLVCNNRVDNTLNVLLATTGVGFTNAAPSPIPVGQEPMWVALSTNTLVLDTLTVTDQGASNHSSRMYRLRLP